MTPQGQKKMVNVTAELAGESTDVIIISSHYDTKYFKDFKFVGANDRRIFNRGGSGNRARVGGSADKTEIHVLVCLF